MGKRSRSMDKFLADDNDGSEEEEVSEQEDVKHKSKGKKKDPVESESDEDEGKVKKPAAKKPKSEEGSSKPKTKSKVAGSSDVLKNEDGDYYVSLSKNRRLTVREFKGSILIDIREYYEDKSSGKSLPGKKGISLSPEQWDLIKEVAPAVDKLISKKK